MKKKSSIFIKLKLKFVLLLFTIFFILFLFSFLLLNYLYDVQRIERLEKIEDYTDFVLSYDELNRCVNKDAFTLDNTTFIYECVDEVYLYYGSTKATLEEVLKSHYLSLDDILKSMKKNTNYDENTTLYTRIPTDKRKGYQFEVETQENSSIVTFRAYQD